MEPSGLSRCESQGRSPARGELVVLNGRQSGTRRVLDVPVTLIGRAQGCEVRLNVDGVDSFHCVLATGPDDVTVRDLGSTRGTFVNGQRVSAALLRDGDLLDIGPFRFRVLLSAANSDRDALRIQAAAVAAQQAALDEEEAALVERRLTLEQQEAQLAAHLDEQRMQLIEIAQHQQEERLALTKDRTALAQRTQEPIGDLAIRQIRFNTEREIDSRLLQEGWQCLEQDQQRWRKRRNREGLALRVRRLQLVESERKLALARGLLLQEKLAWETQQRTLEGELHGLNTRVAHQRQKMQDQAALTLEVKAEAIDQAPEPQTPNVAAVRAADLARVAAQIADQRAELLEQWERLARIEQAWQERHDEAAIELDALAERLARQEELLTQRERDVESCEGRLQQWQVRLEQERRATTGAQIRVDARLQAWESEREQILAEACRVSELARAQLDALGELRQKWHRKRHDETEALNAERWAAERFRQDLARSRQELAAQAQQLDDGRRALVEQAMALEEQAMPCAEGAGERMLHLRRGWLKQNAAVLRALKLERAGLKQDLDALNRLQTELAAQAEGVALARADCQEQETSLELREAALAANQAHLNQQQWRAETRRQHTERRLALLQEETEQLARALIPDTDRPTPALERAA